KNCFRKAPTIYHNGMRGRHTDIFDEGMRPNAEALGVV
ncbi:hypothetical protein PSYJA_45276, partial [Pseudomonas syringae pv. japonica str. M301072]